MVVSISHRILQVLSVIFLILIISSCVDEIKPNKSYADFVNDQIFPAFNEELIFQIKGDTVSGYAFLANDSTLKETIILVQGYPGNDNNFDLAQALRRNGKNVIHFSHRGAWGSQGKYMYSNCLEDIDIVIEYLVQPEVSTRLRIDSTRIGLIGRSYGGGISLIQGSKNKYIKKIIAISTTILDHNRNCANCKKEVSIVNLSLRQLKNLCLHSKSAKPTLNWQNTKELIIR